MTGFENLLCSFKHLYFKHAVLKHEAVHFHWMKPDDAQDRQVNINKKCNDVHVDLYIHKFVWH